MKLQVAIVGAGPAGLFAAEKLAHEGFGVAIINRDIKPGGMAEYGIFPDKHNLKNGLRRQFQSILSSEKILYFGNLPVGIDKCIHLEDLLEWGFDAVLVASGAQGTKWLGIPGEKLAGVYHAKEVVYNYNKLPPFSMHDIKVGKRAAIVGVGNVMADITHYLVKYREAEEIYVIGRRGPAEVKFDKKELEAIINSFDLQDLDAEIARVAPVMNALGQNPEAEKSFILSALEKGAPREGKATIKIRFLTSPREIIGDSDGNVSALVVEDNTLILDNGYVAAKGTGHFHTMDMDTVIFAIGDRVEEELGLPVDRNEYRCAKNPTYAIEGQSYEVEDPQTGAALKGMFVAGWARKPSSGLVGNAKKDGTNSAAAIIQYLNALDQKMGIDSVLLQKRLSSQSCPVVDKEGLARLNENEKLCACELGLPEFKYRTNEEMLKAIGLT